MNLAEKFYQVTKNNGNKIAVIEEGQELTYRQLWDKINTLSNGLREIGIKEADNVVIILPSCIDFIISFFALLKINAVAVPLEPVFTTREYKEMFTECSPQAVITSSYITTKVLGYKKSLLENKQLIVFDNDPWVKQKYPGSYNFDYLYNLGESQDTEEITSKDNQIASINYTYRGYGYPVGALLTHNNYYSSVSAFSENLSEHKIFLSLLPMAHVFSLVAGVLAPIVYGKTLVIMKSHSARQIFHTISEYKVDYMIGVPSLYIYLMKSFKSCKDKYDISSLKYSISGGNYLPVDVHKKVEDTLKIKVYQGYGLTEGLIISCNPKSNNKPGTLGIPGNDVEIKIVDESGNEVPFGEKGEIIIKSPNVMAGFYKREKETKEALKENWLYTGDYGRLDSNGYLYFEELKKKIAKVAGHSVDVQEIERVLETHPCISKVKAYSEQNELWGQIIGVDVLIGRNIIKEEIRSYCIEKLCSYKIPKVINVVKEKFLINVMIVDDDNVALEMIATVLNEESYCTVVARNGEEALTIVEKKKPDIIIMDVFMPGIDGVEAVEKIRENKHTKEVPIIMVSGERETMNYIRTVGMNSVSCFDKPVDPQGLITQIEGYLSNKL